MKKLKKFYLEEMSDNELFFVKKKLRIELQRLFKTMKIGYSACIVIIVIFGIILSLLVQYAPIDPEEIETVEISTSEFTKLIIIAGIAFIFIVSLAFLLSYYINVYPLRKDLREKMKIVEQASITEKKYMHLNDTYHFYIDSPTKISIEVSDSDFKKFEIGDEVNLEYSQFAKEDFGYF